MSDNDKKFYDGGTWFWPYADHKMANASDDERREFDFDNAVKWFEAVWDDDDFTIGTAFLVSAMMESFVRQELKRMDAMPENFDALREMYLNVLSNMSSEKEDSRTVGLPTTLATPKGAIIH